MYGLGSTPGSRPRSPAMPVPTSTAPSHSAIRAVEAALEQIERQRPRRDEEDEDPDRPVVEPVVAACCARGSCARTRIRRESRARILLYQSITRPHLTRESRSARCRSRPRDSTSPRAGRSGSGRDGRRRLPRPRAESRALGADEEREPRGPAMRQLVEVARRRRGREGDEVKPRAFKPASAAGHCPPGSTAARTERAGPPPSTCGSPCDRADRTKRDRAARRPRRSRGVPEHAADVVRVGHALQDHDEPCSREEVVNDRR